MGERFVILWRQFPASFRTYDAFPRLAMNVSVSLNVAACLVANFNAVLLMAKLTHFDDDGNARMVAVSGKQVTLRSARVSGRVKMLASTAKQISDQTLSKGDVISIARIAGIMAAKKTSDLIPLCHPISLDSVELSFEFEDETTLAVNATVLAEQKTGVEMEAFTAVSVACLTVYDMCKSVDRSMSISEVRLELKSGGKSGDFERSES